MTNKHERLGDLLRDLEHQLYRANLPANFQPSNLPSADPNLRPLVLTERQRQQLEQRILSTRLNILYAGKEEMITRRGQADQWIQEEIEKLEQELRSGEK
jgi:hypothetical protein